MGKKTKLVYRDKMPSSVVVTLCLLRQRVQLSREVSDDIVRARGIVTRCNVTGYDLNNTFREEQSFFDDRHHGLIRGWYCSNGSLWKEIPVIGGKWHGRVRYWWENGRQQWEIPYVNNDRNGRLLRWSRPQMMEGVHHSTLHLSLSFVVARSLTLDAPSSSPPYPPCPFRPADIGARGLCACRARGNHAPCTAPGRDRCLDRCGTLAFAHRTAP